MTQRWLGGYITNNPTEPTSTVAKGVCTLAEQLVHEAAGNWPSASSGAATKTFRAEINDSANATTYSSWGSITVDAADTQVVIGVVAPGGTGNISSATVTGNNSGAHTATLDLNTSQADYAGFIRATISGDTSVTVSITFSTGMNRAGIALWSVQNMASAVSASNDTDTTSAYAATITTPANGLGFAIVHDSNTGSPTISWTTYTEDDEDLGESNRRFGCASIAGSDTTGPTATYSASSGGRLAVVTYAAA